MHTQVDKPNAIVRQIGLGMTPSQMQQGVAGGPMAAINCPFPKIPVIEYVSKTIKLPLTDDQIDSILGANVDLLATDATDGISAVDTSFYKAGFLQLDLLLAGFGFHVYGEPLTFSTIGNAIPAAAASPVFSPDAFTENDLVNAALSATYTAAGDIAPAVFEWGFPVWEAAWAMANAYQFVWTMWQRYKVVNELVQDVCYFGPLAEAIAAGTSDVIVQQYLADMNSIYRANGATKVFQPVGARRVGSTNAGGATNYGLFHVSRDFDLAEATHGGLRNQGTVGQHPFRKLPKPVYMQTGVPIAMNLVQQDATMYAIMKRYLSQSEGLSSTNALITFDGTANGLTATGTHVGYEYTTESAPSNVAQSYNTDRYLFKGGTLRMATLLKGVEVWGDWSQWINANAGVAGIVTRATVGNGGGF